MIPADTLLDPGRRGSAAQKLYDGLTRLVIGQDHAIDEIVAAFEHHDGGFCDPRRTVANFLFLGPTGTGKTRIVEAFAEALHGSPKSLIKIDCAEYRHSHEISKLIGSPPGYLGHRETSPQITQAKLGAVTSERSLISIVLFDEIEKSNDSLWNLLLGVLDKGTLTLGDNTKVDMTRCMVFMTGNLGAAEMAHAAGDRIGFDHAAGPKAVGESELARIGTGAARKRFTPEFMNRLDRVVTFRALTDAELRAILDLELATVQKRIFDLGAKKAFAFRLSEAVFDVVLHDGYDPRYGARHLKRAIDRLLSRPLARLVSSGQIEGGDAIAVDWDGSAMSFRCEAKAGEVAQMKAAG